MMKKYIPPQILVRDVLVNRFMERWSVNTNGNSPSALTGLNYGGDSFIASGDELAKDRYDLWAEDRNAGLW